MALGKGCESLRSGSKVCKKAYLLAGGQLLVPRTMCQAQTHLGLVLETKSSDCFLKHWSSSRPVWTPYPVPMTPSVVLSQASLRCLADEFSLLCGHLRVSVQGQFIWPASSS